MALQGLTGSYTTEFGTIHPNAVATGIHMYTHFIEFVSKKENYLKLGIWIDEAAYLAQKQPIAYAESTLTGAEFDAFFSPTALDQAGNRTAVYNNLKTQAPFIGWSDWTV